MLHIGSCQCTTGCSLKSCVCRQQGRQCNRECHPIHTCLYCQGKRSDSEVLEVDSGTVTEDHSLSEDESVWVTINGCELLLKDKLSIERGDWLNDRIISGWLNLLKDKFPNVGCILQ